MGINTIGISGVLSMVQRIAPTVMPMRDVLRRRSFFLTLPLFFVLFPQASFACTQHEHLCIYHALGAPVSVEPQIPGLVPNGDSLVIYSIGKHPTTGAPSTVDFDNKVLLPSKTGDRVFTSTTNFNTSTGTAIVSATAYGQAHPPPDWKEPGDGGLQVYGSQYQVIFNNLTATAKHTGDPGGGEEGNIPNPTSCPNMPGATNCEAAVITGNVPSGIYEQKVRIFNFPGIANPQVDIQAGAYVTGQLVLVSGTHENRQQAYFPKLSGTGDISPTYQYEVYNRGWNPHAAGVASYDLSKSRSWVNDVELGDHSRRIDTYRRTDTTHHQIYGDSGWDEKSYSSKTERIGTRFIAAPESPIFCTDGKSSISCDTKGAVPYGSRDAAIYEAFWDEKRKSDAEHFAKMKAAGFDVDVYCQSNPCIRAPTPEESSLSHRAKVAGYNFVTNKLYRDDVLYKAKTEVPIFIVENAPVTGNIVAGYETLVGKDLHGQPVSAIGRAFSAGGILFPQAKHGDEALDVLRFSNKAIKDASALRTEKGFDIDQQIIVEMAKRDKKSGGFSTADMNAYVDLNNGLKNPLDNVRGPEIHLNRQNPFLHGHVGPVNHIPIND